MKPRSDFYLCRGYLQPSCKECIRRYNGTRYPKIKKRILEGKRVRLYGVTPENYETLFKEQNGLCAICERPPKNRLLDVDHDHKTGKLRGLLCMNCNNGLGRFGDNPELLEKAAAYLQKYRVNQDFEVKAS